MLMIRARTGLERFLDFGFLLLASERYDWPIVLLLNVVMAWTWVQMAKWYALVFSYFCANPVSDILLVHRMLIGVVLPRAGCIHIAALDIWF